MKFLAIIAEIIVALDCFLKGMGIEQQNLASNQSLFIWYIIGVLWLLNAFNLLILVDFKKK